MRYSSINKSGTACSAAVGSPGLRIGSGLNGILDLAAQQRLRSTSHAPLTAGIKPGREKRVRSSVRLSQLPIPGRLISSETPRNVAILGVIERSGLAFRDPDLRMGRTGDGLSGHLD